MEVGVIETDNALPPRSFLNAMDIQDFREASQIIDKTIEIILFEIKLGVIAIPTDFCVMNHRTPFFHLLQCEATLELDILAKMKGNAVANHFFIEGDGFFHVGNRQQRAFEFQHNHWF